MRRVLPFNLALASMFLAACVTINVYFPAAAAEKAADRVIENVTGAGTERRNTSGAGAGCTEHRHRYAAVECHPGVDEGPVRTAPSLLC